MWARRPCWMARQRSSSRHNWEPGWTKFELTTIGHRSWKNFSLLTNTLDDSSMFLEQQTEQRSVYLKLNFLDLPSSSPVKLAEDECAKNSMTCFRVLTPTSGILVPFDSESGGKEIRTFRAVRRTSLQRMPPPALPCAWKKLKYFVLYHRN
jgi:hypothetical protein